MTGRRRSCGKLSLAGYDIEGGVLAEYPGKLPVARTYHTYSERYYDRRTGPDDVYDGILCAHSGLEAGPGVKRQFLK